MALLGFSLPWISEEILLSVYIALESTFLAGGAMLSIYLYDLGGEKKGNFSTMCRDMSVSLASSSQVLLEPCLLCSSVSFEGGWQSKEMFFCEMEPFHTLLQSSRAFHHWLRLGACASESLSSPSLFP